MRHPDEIMSIVDQAQRLLGNEFNLRDLIWEILADVMDSLELAISEADYNDLLSSVLVTMEDYLSNHYDK